MKPEYASIIRALMKIGGGAVGINGVKTENTIEVIIAGAVAAWGVIWGVIVSRRKRVQVNVDVSGTATQPTVEVSGKKVFPCLAILALVAGLGVGCITPQNVEGVSSVATLAAYNGTLYYVGEHPESIPGFVEVVAELTEMESRATDVQWAEVLLIVYRLPIKELGSWEAKIIVGNGVLILSRYGNKKDLTQADIRSVVSAIRQGIQMGLP